MDGPTITLLLSAIFGSGGIISAFLMFRKDLKKEPVEKDQAVVANAVSLSAATAEWVNIQKESLREQNDKINALEAKVELSINENKTWRFWYISELVANWQSHRKKDAPPDAPIA